jgi:hypothetical protein
MRYALVLLAVVILAQSQPPTPTPPKVSKTNQQQAEGKNSKTETNQQPATPSPATLYQYFGPITNGEQKKSTNPSENDSSNDGTAKTVSDFILTFATVAIAVLAFFQWQTLKAHKKDFEAIATNMGSALEETRKATESTL